MIWARLLERWRRVRFKLLGAVVLAMIGSFDYYAWKHRTYGQLSVALWIGFGINALISIPVTFFGLILACILLER